MASGVSGETMESWLNKATDPSNPEERWDYIQAFYQLVNQETEGPQMATRLLVHKIQSPQEREALQALTVLEACMNNCGKRFHIEAAKFRFLNELIKVLSPKFLGKWTPDKVKERVTEVFYGWTLWLKDEPKIQEAYHMLKKQGVVKKDPKLPDTIVMPPPSQRTEESVFDQEDKAKLLARLLKSDHAEDLQTANRLIKSTIQEEQEKAEKALRRLSTLGEVANCTRQLRELLDQHNPPGAPSQRADDMKSLSVSRPTLSSLQALYERCDRLRPGLFRLASDTVEDDSALAQILAANDELTLVMNTYKESVGRRRSHRGGGGEAGGNSVPTSPREIKSYHLIDLSASYYDELMQFQMKGVVSEVTEDSTGSNHFLTTGVSGGRDPLLRARGCGGSTVFLNGTKPWTNQQKTLSGSPFISKSKPIAESESALRVESLHLHNSLVDIYVPLETIKPSRLEPITVYDQGGVHVSLHFVKDTPPGHPSIAVVIISTVNTSTLPIEHLLFQAAVPKTMSVKLQPSSGQRLPAYNPLLPPAAISQVMLLANPQRHKVRLRYKLTLLHGDQRLSDTGEVEHFPDWVSCVGL
ncbi:ADP-ribosylation factor-binding protein GGA2-like [Aplochiton taeniatus]